LAGGAGTRLRSLVKDVPKPMADINGKPFICYLLDYLAAYDVKKILLSVGYKYEAIKDYFGVQYKNMNIKYVIEDKPLGTGGALKKALMAAEGEEFMVLNGDTFFNIDLRKMIDFHHAEDSILTIAVKDSRVVGFEEKTFKRCGYINGGVYAMKKTISGFFDPDKDAFSFEVDFLHKKINNIRPFAFISDDYFIDIGMPDDYKKAQEELGPISKGVRR